MCPTYRPWSILLWTPAVVVSGGLLVEQQMIHVGNPAADPTARNCLEVLTAAQKVRSQLLVPKTRITHPAGRRSDSYARLTCRQWVAMATPSGCSLLASADPTSTRIFLRGKRATSHSTRTRVTLGTPWVMVPVLSNITTWICRSKKTPSDSDLAG